MLNSLARLLPLPLLVASSASGPFTVAQITSYPYPTGLVAARGGAAIAWVLDERGVRNVWEAHAPEWAPRQITRFTGDDGQELSQLSFTADGQTVIFVRGGDNDGNWPSANVPNPALAPREPAVQIWAAPVGGDPAPRVLADGAEPSPFPSGGRVAFIRGGQAYVVSLTDGKPATQLFYARGTTSGLTWSPDGSRLAFVSDRGDHSFIGIFTSDSAPIRFLAPTTSGDFAIAWSPDGTRIAYVRVPGDGGPPRPLLEEQPNPWAIWVVDANTGLAHRAWQSPSTLRGSLPDVVGLANLSWAEGDRLIFLAELDGWPHLYSVPAAGGKETRLTTGAFMVEHVAAAGDHRTIVYSANAGPDAADIDRRHLFRLDIVGGVSTPLTAGEGVEWTPVVTGDASTAAYISATATRPPLPTVIALAPGAKPTLLGGDRIPPDFPSASLVTPKMVTFKSGDGTPVHGQLFARPDLSGRHAGVIFVHGGPPRQMMLGWHYMGYYSNSYALNQYLASRGFVVLSVNYRLGIGYGREFQHPPHSGPWGAAEYKDVVAGWRFLAAQPLVDSKRIGIWGGSYGGFLTATALGRNSDLFAAGVDLHGVHDWASEAQEVFSPPPWRYEKGDLAQAREIAWRSSPNSAIAQWRSPVLLIQGDDDHNVHFHETVDLARRLEHAGVPFEELVFPDELHSFVLYRTWVSADSATAAFLEAHLSAHNDAP